MDFAQIVLARLEELGLKIAQAEDRYGLGRGYLWGVVRTDSKRAVPNLLKAEAICDALGLELKIGPKGHKDDTPNADMTAFAQIPLHDALLAAGGGAVNGDAAIIDHLAFRKSWLTRVGTSPNSAVLARASGDSMAPTINDGDMLLIDRSKQPPSPRQRGLKDTRPAPIYAVLDDGTARVKRVEMAPGEHWALLSDNPVFAPEFRPLKAVEFIGKVVWWGHTVRDR